MIYLDYSANTPSCEEVLLSFLEAERNYPGNANSDHTPGRQAKAEMARITSSVADMLGVRANEVIFTSGSSESNNTAIFGITAHKNKGHIITTKLEHASVSEPMRILEAGGFDVDYADIMPDGKVSPDSVEKLIRGDTVLVSVTAVDSELGTVQPIREISEVVKSHPGCVFHVDATQAVGKIPFSLDGVDISCCSPHKFYGICGVGIMIKKSHIRLEPLIHGGSSTTLYRSGTPALSLAASAEKALELANVHLTERYETGKRHNDELREFFKAYDKVKINSPSDAIPHILNLSVDGVKGTVFRRELDKYGVCVSVKSACSSDGMPSDAVLAICGDRRRALSSWRISLSHLTTTDEIEQFKEIFDRCYNALIK